MSKVAAFKRIGKSGEWLRWMAKELLEQKGMTLPKPEFLGEHIANQLNFRSVDWPHPASPCGPHSFRVA